MNIRMEEKKKFEEQQDQDYKCTRYVFSSRYLVAFVTAMRAVMIARAVCIALLKTSSIVAKYTKVLTTAMKESQKSRN